MFQQSLIPCGPLALNVARGPAAGPPLVLLHGVTRSWRDFAPLFGALLPRWQLYAIDLRGHGQSDRAAGRYKVVDYVDDVVALVRSLPGSPAVIYGHSLGAMVALVVADKLPDRVRGIVLEEPPFETMGARIHETPLHGYFSDLERLSVAGRSVAEIALDLADLRMTTPGSGPSVRLGDIRDAASLRFAASCLRVLHWDVFTPIIAGRWLEGYDRASLFERVTRPTLLLQADPQAGGMLSSADAEQAAATMPDCTWIQVPTAGHLIHWTHTETLTRLVLAFLEAMNAGG